MRALGWANPPDWLNDPTWIYPGLVLVGVWGIGGAVIINLAGLQNVPTELYDAAKIDGAGWWAQMRHVTLPLMSPVIFYSLTLGLVEVMQYFLVPFVLKNGTGEPGGSTYFFNLYIYKSFFTFQRMSYGATLAWMLFVITLVLTLALFASARRWVYYAGDRELVTAAATRRRCRARRRGDRRYADQAARPLISAPRIRKAGVRFC